MQIVNASPAIPPRPKGAVAAPSGTFGNSPAFQSSVAGRQPTRVPEGRLKTLPGSRLSGTERPVATPRPSTEVLGYSHSVPPARQRGTTIEAVVASSDTLRCSVLPGSARTSACLKHSKPGTLLRDCQHPMNFESGHGGRPGCRRPRSTRSRRRPGIHSTRRGPCLRAHAERD